MATEERAAEALSSGPDVLREEGQKATPPARSLPDCLCERADGAQVRTQEGALHGRLRIVAKGVPLLGLEEHEGHDGGRADAAADQGLADLVRVAGLLADKFGDVPQHHGGQAHQRRSPIVVLGQRRVIAHLCLQGCGQVYFSIFTIVIQLFLC